jgi:hypothetical protein
LVGGAGLGGAAVEWYQLGREICSVLLRVFGVSQAFGTVDLFGCMLTVGRVKCK